MSLILIIGPMKSGKSLELIARVAPYEFAKKKVLYIQPTRNVRDDGINSRSGLNTKAIKVNSIKHIKDEFDVIGIDEVHMFDQSDIKVIRKWLNADKKVIVSGLDTDYQGKLMKTVKKLLELKPEKIISKPSVCEKCHKYTAAYSQILKNGREITSGLPAVVPDDGHYTYEPRCRKCFVTK